MMPFDIFSIPITLTFNEIRDDKFDIYFNVHICTDTKGNMN